MNLEELNLRNTHLRRYDFNWLKNSTNFKRLDISMNHLKILELQNIPELLHHMSLSIVILQGN